MRGFDSRFLEDLKNKNEISEVISRYVRLEQKGGNLWGRCPFHHEKTASFSVNLSGQFFYCFGCHKSGDVISFIMEIESLDFNDAVKFLADRVKMPLPEVRYDDEKVKEQKKHKERVLALLKDTAYFYVNNLRSGNAKDHLAYIEKRKLSPETVTKFGIGASLDYNGLPDYLLSKGYTVKEMEDGAVVGKNKDGRLFDFLGGRLIIPLIDQFGSVIAFCGRIIDNNKKAGKYVNSRDSYVFTKGKNLFNLNNLKKLKNQKGLEEIIIVEGHMDVVSLVQAGFENVVASMGTALTKDQARIIKRYANKVYISYDGDFAGQKASIRGLEILKEEGLDVKVVSLPDGMDPDDVIKTSGAEGYSKCLSEAKPLIDFKLDIIRKTFDISTVDGKRKYITNAVKVIRESDSPAEQEDLLKVVRDLTGTTYESLKRELYSVAEKPEENAPTTNFSENTGDKNLRASRFIVYCHLFGKDFANPLDLSEIDFDNLTHRKIMGYVAQCKQDGVTPRFSDLYELLEESDQEELSQIAEIETDENKSFDQGSYYNDCIKTLKIYTLNLKIDKLTELFKHERDLEKRREFTKEMATLLSKRSKIN